MSAHRLFMDSRKAKNKAEKEIFERQTNNGVLYCSGMIAGEGIVGILLAIFALIPFAGDTFGGWLGSLLNLGGTIGTIGSGVVLALMVLSLLKFSLWSKEAKGSK